MALSQLTLLDAARQHFERVSKSPAWSKSDRNKARGLQRECEAEIGKIAAMCAGHNPNGSSGAPLALVA